MASFTDDDLELLRQHRAIDRLDFHREAGSTNDLALAADDLGDETLRLILAERQTAGRGRRANTWWAGEGGLTFTLVLNTAKIGLEQNLWPMLSLAAGLGTANALAEFLPDAELTVKWPNDVYVIDRKVAGILTETRGDAPDHVLIGIGVNVNSRTNEAPDELRQVAVSMADLGANLRLAEVLIAIIEHLSSCVDLLHQPSDTFIRRLNARSFLTGRRIAVDTESERITGLCRGVADTGALIVDTPSGPRSIIAGSISMLDHTNRG